MLAGGGTQELCLCLLKGLLKSKQKQMDGKKSFTVRLTEQTCCEIHVQELGYRNLLKSLSKSKLSKSNWIDGNKSFSQYTHFGCVFLQHYGVCKSILPCQYLNRSLSVVLNNHIHYFISVLSSFYYKRKIISMRFRDVTS